MTIPARERTARNIHTARSPRKHASLRCIVVVHVDDDAYERATIARVTTPRSDSRGLVTPINLQLEGMYESVALVGALSVLQWDSFLSGGGTVHYRPISRAYFPALQSRPFRFGVGDHAHVARFSLERLERSNST